jgi:non-lysosomal glucosylceramidase
MMETAVIVAARLLVIWPPWSLLALLICAGTAEGSSSSSLFELLRRVPFRNAGVTLRSHRYTWETVPVASGSMFYLEKQNVTCTQCNWGGNKGTHRFLITANGPTATDRAVPPSGIRSAVPLGGISAGSVELRGDGSWQEWTIQNQSPAGAAKISAMPDALLALRLCGGSGRAAGAGAGVSGTPTACSARLLQTHPRGPAANVSALPPINGLNYSGTYPVSRFVPVDAMMSNATGPGLDVALFAYSSLAAGDMEASARPAIAFTLAVRNTGPHEANASLLLNMPLQVETDQARTGAALGAAFNTTGSQACAEACQANAACMSWTHTRGRGILGGSCQLHSSVGLNRYTHGSDAGVRGRWSVDSDGRCVTLTRPGDAPTSGTVSLCTGGSSSKVVAHSDLQTVLSTFGTTGSVGRSIGGLQGAASVGVTVPPGTNRTISLTLGWRFPLRDWYNYDCDKDGGWSATTCGGRYDSDSNLEVPVVNATLAYKNRYAELYGTAREAAWVETAEASPAADETEAQLIATIRNISAVHSVFMAEGSSLPDWLQDQLVNSISHVRNSYWFSNISCPRCTRSADPRMSSAPVLWRQFEAFDCTDLDSIHNDGERHLPYIMLWPMAERSKLAAWAYNQAPPGWKQEGMLAEQIHQNTPDMPDGWTSNNTGTGRHMGDSSSAFVLEVLELYRWSNDTTTLKLYWHTIKQIVHWQLQQSEGLGLPMQLQTSYDILGFPQYELCAYNSVFHLATLAAAAELADAMADTDFAAACRANLANATAAFDTLQWNSTMQAYAAGSDGCTTGGCDRGIGIFADSFYAQVLAYSAGLGTIVSNPARLRSHLQTELRTNCIYYPNSSSPVQPNVCPNGIVALTGRIPSHKADEQVWEMAPPNHATLGLHLGQPVAEMLAVFEPSATSYSRRINDQWNIAGLKDTAGYPTATSHFGMHMVSWHIALALSGQQANLPNGSLVFFPRLRAPYSLPVLLPGVLGVLASARAGRCTLRLTVGELQLAMLAVDDRAAPGLSVRLVAGGPAVVW